MVKSFRPTSVVRDLIKPHIRRFQKIVKGNNFLKSHVSLPIRSLSSALGTYFFVSAPSAGKEHHHHKHHGDAGKDEAAK